MKTRSAWTLVCAGALTALLCAACPVDVELAYPGSCDTEGGVVLDGESALGADGCNTCTCNGGKLSCTEMYCGDPCEDSDPPPCADMPVDDLGCYAEPICGADGWECRETCPCAALSAPECPVPFDGCYYEGPFCDGEQWSCGAPVCPPCAGQPTLCDPSGDPLCYFEPYCDESLGWQCQEICEEECTEPPPECLGVTFASCEQGAWVCKGNETCGPEMIDCPPSPYPYCVAYAECAQGGWLCQESCETLYCPDQEPICEPMGPASCTPYPICTSAGWQCAETCS